MRKLKTLIQTVIVIVILFLLASPILVTYAKNISEKNEIITVEETKEEEEKEEYLLTAGIETVLEEELPYENVQRRELTLVSIGDYKLTAYCSCERCCGKWSQFNKTASGTTPQQGRTVACNSLEFGTRIVINGSVYTVEDTGNMGTNVIDIYFNSHEAALNFGEQYAEVYKFE
jgi:3D (Asp-Asp-Asp) domain-containing protein